ncbi:histidine phosphatase family protein [Paracoccus marinaquae]|uniref:Histidine phosphatase family protein n=1 Tax=Paracoccus marinaquae TaxID=2841926 RepID=A0ABS6AQG8_9RHOB|nr:histidine phosphatase family protein [Paracoccus marinaquae]MBU3031884.1 histidine phosphatase family protein [Paracoccus marinaquae]
MPARRLTLVAHASTRGLRSAVFGARDDIDAAGRQAAGHLSSGLGKVDRLLISPAPAAAQTAAALGLSGVIDDALRDCDFGRWSGQSFGQVLRHEPRSLVSWMRRPETAPHGGEAVADLCERVGVWLDARSRERGRGLAITHASVIRAAIVHVIGAGPASFWRIDVAPLAFADFRSNGRRWVFRGLGAPQAAERDG